MAVMVEERQPDRTQRSPIDGVPGDHRPRNEERTTHRERGRDLNLGEAVEVLLRRRERGMTPEYYLG